MEAPQAPQDEHDDASIVEALNRHGMFFQRAIYNRFLDYKHAENRKNPFKVYSVFHEHPTYFNGHGAADLVVRARFMADVNKPAVDLMFVVECKKVFPPLNRIVFFGDALKHQTRLMWESSAIGDGNRAYHHLGGIGFDGEPITAVCNDGLWLDKGKATDKNWKANKDPLYKAANQVCSHLMGMMSATRSRAIEAVSSGWKHPSTFFLPIIVTNCPLYVAECPEGATDLDSGSASEVSLKSVESAFYIHPFARIPGDETDVRNDYDDYGHEDMERDKHSILILGPAALECLFGESLKEDDLVNVLYRPLFDHCIVS